MNPEDLIKQQFSKYQEGDRENVSLELINYILEVVQEYPLNTSDHHENRVIKINNKIREIAKKNADN